MPLRFEFGRLISQVTPRQGTQSSGDSSSVTCSLVAPAEEPETQSMWPCPALTNCIFVSFLLHNPGLVEGDCQLLTKAK